MGVGRGCGGGGVYAGLHCHHRNDLCIQMGSDENRFNASLTVSGRVKRRCPKITVFERKGEAHGNRYVLMNSVSL